MRKSLGFKLFFNHLFSLTLSLFFFLRPSTPNMRTIDYSDKVPGLIVIEDFVSPEEEMTVIDAADKQIWSGLGIG